MISLVNSYERFRGGTMLPELLFTKSRHCNTGTCVEVAPLTTGEVAVRDSKNPNNPPLIFTRDEWTDFLKAVKEGDFVY